MNKRLLILACAACLPAIPAAYAQDAATGLQQRLGDAAVALTRGSVDQAVVHYSEALKDTSIGNDRRATILNDRAVAYGRLSQPRAAMEDFNRAVQLFPEYAPIYNNRGSLLLQLGLPKEAIKDFDRAILLAPGYAAAYNNRAGTYAKLGQHTEAIRDYTKAIELMPASATPLQGRGRAHLAQNRPHAAIRDLTRAVNADARFASAYRSRAEAKLAVDMSEDAIADLSRSIAFDVANAEIYLLRGFAYLGGDNTASAIKDFTRAIEIAPQSSAGHAARGLAHAFADAFEEAEADLNKAIELDPKSALAFAYRALSYKRSKQPEIGQKDIQTASKLDPTRPQVLWVNAEYEETAGRIDNAVDLARRALAADPSLKQARQLLERLNASEGDAGTSTVAGAGIESWNVVKTRRGYHAESREFPKLRVPLEMMGEGTPRLLEWELKKPPLKGIGTLRFHGGTVAGKSGPEETEFVAIVDTSSDTVVGIEPHRQGTRVSNWTWEEGKVTVASIDGVTDEFNLRAVKKDAPQMSDRQGEKRYRSADRNEEAWAPWNTPWGMPGAGSERRRTAQPQPRQQKPKTLFDLLFKN